MVSSRVGDSVDNQDKCWPQPVFSEGVIIINYYCRFAILLQHQKRFYMLWNSDHKPYELVNNLTSSNSAEPSC